MMKAPLLIPRAYISRYFCDDPPGLLERLDSWGRDTVLTTHRLAYLCCQCDASLDMELALVLVVARNER